MKETYMSETDKRRFKACMVAAGYNVTSLANEVGMVRQSLAARINGKIDFNRTEMMKIGKVLNQDPEMIFFGEKVS
jgi:DNA-binding XRE family transcriptional regulator